ncbi:hypothetical protein CPB86DRAFT_877317 [Serendipita vermifera]|nr:hypothetical protein CPB86DRAFT_877317 [Serendipita vermifera]
MPLKALLLPELGEKPSTLKLPPHPAAAGIDPKALSSPSSASQFISPDYTASPPFGSSSNRPGVQSASDDTFEDLTLPYDKRWSSSSKPLPSPRSLSPREKNNRDSNQTSQTGLTLPTTSGSSRSSSTDHTLSPPLSPSPTSPYPRGHSSSPNGNGSLNLNISMRKNTGFSPNTSQLLFTRLMVPEMDSRGRPILKLATTMPKVGSGVRYVSSGNKEDDPNTEGDSRAGSSRDHDGNRFGQETARRAVDQRLHHLMVVTTSPSSRPVSPVSSSSNQHTIRPEDPTRGSSEKSRHKSQSGPYHFTSMNPPPPPMRGLPPFKILSDEETAEILEKMVALSSLSGRKVTLGWSRQNTKSRVAGKSRGKRGKYIRLVTLPAVPDVQLQEDESDPVNAEKRLAKKGRLPTILVDINEDDEEESTHEKKTAFIPSVYMTEIVAAQYSHPIACMMLPLLDQSNLEAASRPTSFSSTFSGAAPSKQRIVPLPPLAYQVPLPHLTRNQKLALHAAKLLVYAVPREYSGPVPPPELEIVEEEVLAPWATSSHNHLGLTLGPRIDDVPQSPRNFGSGALPSPGLSPRWGAAVEGLWSKTSKRASNASVQNFDGNGNDLPDKSRLSVSSRPTSGMSFTAEPKPPVTSPSNTTGWSNSFNSLKSRAQEYYASTRTNAAAQPSPLATQVLTPSASAPSIELSQPPAQASGPSSSRSFGSFFSRAASSVNLGTEANQTASTSAATTPLTTPPINEEPRISSETGSELLFDSSRTNSLVTDSKGALTTAPTAAATTGKGWRGWTSRWAS